MRVLRTLAILAACFFTLVPASAQTVPVYPSLPSGVVAGCVYYPSGPPWTVSSMVFSMPQQCNSSGYELVALAGANTVGLVAGSAVIGKVGIDQTTPGTTNLVQVGGTLPAYASVPAFKIDQTTPGTTNLVQIGGSLPSFASTPTFNCGSGCSAPVPWAYALVTGTAGASISVTANGSTVCSSGSVSWCVVKNSACTFGGIKNTSVQAQPATLGFIAYNNASTNSGDVITNVGSSSGQPLGPSQVISEPFPGTNYNNGCVVSLYGSGSTNSGAGTGIVFMYK